MKNLCEDTRIEQWDHDNKKEKTRIYGPLCNACDFYNMCSLQCVRLKNAKLTGIATS